MAGSLPVWRATNGRCAIGGVVWRREAEQMNYRVRIRLGRLAAFAVVLTLRSLVVLVM